MQLLPTLTTIPAEDATPFLSHGGLVDRQTASADDVVLWTDPEIIAGMEPMDPAVARLAPWRSRLA